MQRDIAQDEGRPTNRATSLKATDVDLDVLDGTLSFFIRSINIAVTRDLDRRLEGLGRRHVSGQRTVLISGASRGIGHALAERLARDGWNLSLGMGTPVMPSFADAARTDLQAYDAAVGGEAAWVETALSRFGRIDAIVANAGIMIPKTVIEAEDAGHPLASSLLLTGPAGCAARACLRQRRPTTK